MLLEEKTIEKFGYSAESLSKTCEKKILYMCSVCDKESQVGARVYYKRNGICYTCNRANNHADPNSGYNTQEYRSLRSRVATKHNKDRMKKTLDVVLRHCEERNLKMLDEKLPDSKIKLNIECPTHGVFKINKHHLLSGIGCSSCSNNKRNTQESVEKYVVSRGYILRSTYKNNKTKISLECKKHGVFKVRYDNFKNLNHQCMQCSKETRESKGERECREIIENLTGKKFPTKRPKFLTNPETGYSLELDGYCKEINLAFEYDGEQHFKPIEWMGGEEKFKQTQKLDKLKNDLCKSSKITLIRIPFTIKNIENYIKRKLVENEII